MARYTTVGGYPNTDPYYVSPEEEAEMEAAYNASMEAAYNAHIQREYEAAMAPRENPSHPIFRDHNCAYCDDGEKPCRRGNPSRCDNPHARND